MLTYTLSRLADEFEKNKKIYKKIKKYSKKYNLSRPACEVRYDFEKYRCDKGENYEKSL
ncbi:MAG: hypothetical protein L6V93_07570 [Clostridiales bacterium]|nr:MAG: hypothetical protein L6V93_07570 [Clostridiales bacterium]